MESSISTVIDETLLTGADGQTSALDDKTLSCTPAPMAASTVTREKWSQRRVLPDDFGSFLTNQSKSVAEKEDGSSDDRSSLGLLPSNCLLDLETDLLRSNSICMSKSILPLDPPAEAHSSNVNDSQQNYILDSGSSREYNTTDSHEYQTAIKKYPQGTGTRGDGRYLPQALFQSVEEESESRLSEKAETSAANSMDPIDNKMEGEEQHQVSDSGMGQTDFTGSHRQQKSSMMNSEFDLPTPRAIQRVGEAEEKTLVIQNQEEDLDHTLHQVALEAEDLEELEEAFSDFDEGSSDEEMVPKVPVDVNSNPQNIPSSYTENEEVGYGPPDEGNHAALLMDGPFKIPALPGKGLTNKVPPDNEGARFGGSCQDESSVFGDSIPFHQSGSAVDWGPSIEFGDSLQIQESLSGPADMQNTDGKKKGYESPLQGDLKDRPDFADRPAVLSRNDQNPFEDLEMDPHQFKLDSGKSPFPPAINTSKESYDTYHKNAGEDDSLFGIGPSDKNRTDYQFSHNPFGDFGDVDEIGDFGEEDFIIDSDAAALMLNQDAEQFNKDNMMVDELYNTTVGSVRGEDQTYLNMTIGTYMAAKSGDLGSLSYQDKRPEFGMPVRSPPANRIVGPILSPGEIFRSPDGNRIRQSPLGEFGSSSRQSNTDRSDFVLLHQGVSPSKLTSTKVSEKDSHVRNLNASFDSNSFNHTQKPISSMGNASQQPEEIFTVKHLSRPPSTGLQEHPDLQGFHAAEPEAIFYRESPRQLSGENTKKSLPHDRSSKNRNQQFLLDTEAFTNSPADSPGQSPKTRENDLQTPFSIGKETVDATLSISQLSSTKPHDGSSNSIPGDLTFSSVHKIFDRSDLSFSNPGEFILTELKRKISRKKEVTETKQIEIKPEGSYDQQDKQISKLPVREVSSQQNLTSKKTDSQQQDVKISGYPSEANVLNKATVSRQILSPRQKDGMEKRIEPPSHNSSVLHREVTEFADKDAESAQVPSRPRKSPDCFPQKDVMSGTKPKQVPYLSDDVPLPLTVDVLPERETARTLPSSELPKHIKNPPKKSAIPQLQRNAPSRAAVRPAVPETKRYQSDTLPSKTYVSQSNFQSIPNPKDSQMMPPPRSVLLSKPEDYSNSDGNHTLESVTINSDCSQMEKSTAMNFPDNERTVTHFSFVQKEISQKQNQIPVTEKPQSFSSLPAQQLPNTTIDSSMYGGEESLMSQFHSLLPDTTGSVLHYTEIHDEFASSTPLSGHQPTVQKFTNTTQMSEKSILPMITPKAVCNILEVPDVVQIPEVCCVHLSQQVMFTLRNLLDRGVKCVLTFREVTCKGQRMNMNYCPFELKRQVIMSPSSSQSVQVIFRPKDQGEFVATVEIFSQNLTNPQENRIYTIHLVAYAECPLLKIQPKNDQLDFGNLLWGKTACQTIKIQNVGCATIPLRFSIIRKESSLCSFSFCPENPTDVSTISLTTRPTAVSAVYSMSLEGKKEGQEVRTEIINIYCQAKEPENVNQRYLEKAEQFQAVLTIDVDMPIEDFRPLSQISLRVLVGMYKLHVDRDRLSISTPAGKTGQGTIQIINSGNIPMPVDISFEPERDHFTLSANHVVVPPHDNCPVHVTFTPQPTRETHDDNKVNLMLWNKLAQHFVSVTGKIKTTETKISSSTAAINFGGVAVGQSMKRKFTFIADNDDNVRIWIKNPGRMFKLLKEDGAFVESIEMSVVKGKQYVVWIIFSPSEVEGYSTDLAVQVLYANRYSIPISGYGGLSCIKLERVSQAETGERWLDVGSLSPGTSIIRKIFVTNTGTRSCYVKASFYDVSRLEFPPYRATIMPSALILSPGATTDLIVMFNPTPKEVDLCKSGRALVALVKLTWGDEILRQMFLRNPGKQPKQLISNYDIPLTSTQREAVDAELRSIRLEGNSYELFKKSMSVIKIGVFGQSAVSSATEPVDTVPCKQTDGHSSSSSQRSVLSTVNQNVRSVRTVEPGKSDWTVTPAEIQLNVGDSCAKDFVQVINFSQTDAEFSVENDRGIIVIPSKGTVGSKNTILLEVRINTAHFPKNQLSPWCGLIRVHCLQEIKYIKVYMPVKAAVSDLPKPSVRPASYPTKGPAAPRQSEPEGVYTSHPTKPHLGDMTSGGSQSLRSSPPGKHMQHTGRIKSSDMAVFPTAEAGTEAELMYFFTNISTEPLQWTATPFAPAYVKHVDNTHSVYRINYDVFKLSSLHGVLQPGETEKVAIEFRPQSQGSYNQTWTIFDNAHEEASSQRFTIYAEATPNSHQNKVPPKPDQLPSGLSRISNPTSPRQSHIHRGLPEHSQESQKSLMSPREPHVTSYLSDGKQLVSRGPSTSRHQETSSPASHTSTGSDKSLDFNKVGQSRRPGTVPHVEIAAQNHTSSVNRGISWSAVSVPVENFSLPVHGKILPSNTNSANDKSIAGSDKVQHSSVKDSVPSTEVSTSSSKSSASSRRPDAAGDNNSTRSERSKNSRPRCLHLVHEVVEFPKLGIGENVVKKIYLKNSTPKDSQVVVEYEPKPPFLIRHQNFKIGKDKMIMFPVTFRPRHIAKVMDKVIFREVGTGNTFTANLVAECVDNSATK